MRALVLERTAPVDQNPLVLRDLLAPVPGPGQVRVRVLYCGLCHTDLHTAEGDLKPPQLPIVPGHQIVGVVEAVGLGTRRLREGDRVGIPWLHSTCGKCRYCTSGSENLCETARFTGFHVNGGYAEFAVVGEDFAYPLPAGFADQHAAPLLCAGIIGYRSYRLSAAQKGDTIGLYGFGASAHIVLQFARYLGCQVFVFTRGEAHRQLALELGAAWTGSSQDRPPSLLDAAIIFAPAGTLVPEALSHLRRGGTLALAGITMSAIPQLDYATLYHERVLRSVANSTRRDAYEFLELAAQVPVKTEVQIFALEQGNAALQALKYSQIRGAGVLKVS